MIVGTKALREPAWFAEMAAKYPGRLVLGLDARDGRVATAGWLDVSDVDAVDLALRFDDLPLAGVIYTDIARDGMLEGPNLEATGALARRLKAPVTASGGVARLEDLAALATLPVAACIVGRALYDGRFRARGSPGTSRRPFHGTLTRALVRPRSPPLVSHPHRCRDRRSGEVAGSIRGPGGGAMTIAYHITDIRNIALAGHGASGKTTLADALLHASGATPRRGSVDDGTSFSDSEDEEKRRHFTIDCHSLHCEWKGKQVHLIDSPGYPDFIGNALSALAAVENVVVAISATSGIEVNTRRIVAEATRHRLGGLVAITKMDAEGANFARVLHDVRQAFGPRCVPFHVPIGQGASFSGVLDVLDPPDELPDDTPMVPGEAYRMVVEQIVEVDEALMERYLEGETIPPETLREAAHRAILSGELVPVVCVSARREVGVREMLDLLAEISLKPDEVHRFGHKAVDDDEIELSPIEDGELVAQVFKTTNDLFVGKLSVLRVHSGRIGHDTTLVNLRTGKTSKPGHLYRLQGKVQEEVKEAIAGDIVAVPKFDDLHISDTVTVAANGQTPRLALNPIRFPTPMVPRAVEPKTREDEPKIAAGLARIADEDPTFTFRRDSQTHELVISGMSELHLDVIQNRLKSRYKLDISTHVPHVPYLETIGSEAEARHRHKKQTGGRGQFADVQLRVRPRARGEGSPSSTPSEAG